MRSPDCTECGNPKLEQVGPLARSLDAFKLLFNLMRLWFTYRQALMVSCALGGCSCISACTRPCLLSSPLRFLCRCDVVRCWNTVPGTCAASDINRSCLLSVLTVTCKVHKMECITYTAWHHENTVKLSTAAMALWQRIKGLVLAVLPIHTGPLS